MALLSEAFGLVRVIHLPDRKDRFREVSAQLEALGLRFGAGGVELYEATRPAAIAGFPSLGSHGCFLSHLAILRDARDRGVDSVLVMEDDFEVPVDDARRVGALAATLRERAWGFAYLGHIEELPPRVPGAVPDFCEYTGAVRQAHLFAVHREVLPGLVDYLEGCLVRPPGRPGGRSDGCGWRVHHVSRGAPRSGDAAGTAFDGQAEKLTERYPVSQDGDDPGDPGGVCAGAAECGGR